VRILIVDDDESVHWYLKAILEPFARCEAVLSGEEGVRLFDAAHEEGAPYDAVFMDILMPAMDGHQAAEIMRSHEEKLGVDKLFAFKLVMITSLVDDANVSRAFFQAHASCYIVKPLDKDKVIEELKQNLVL
jgi:two-component system chemotaxis response regulator CheY